MPKDTDAILRRCLSRLGPDLDYLFIINLFDRGGAEVETLHMMRVLRSSFPRAKIGLITTLSRPSEWLDRLPAGVRVAEFGRASAALTPARRRTLLVRLLGRLRPRLIHVMGCQLGWDTYRVGGARLARHSTLIGMSFGKEYYARGPFKAARDALKRSGRHIRLVLSDNGTHAREIRRELGFPRAKPLLMPVTTALIPPRARPRSRKLKLLWASRWDAQKRLDVLYRIAMFAPQHEFHVYGGFIGDSGPLLVDLRDLEALENVKIHGPFDGSSEIPFARFDAFLYTSIWDGMPNILLEAAARGLPIIAPDVGGVRELVHGRTGFPVSGSDAVGEYLRELERVRKAPALARKRARAAQRVLAAKHGWPTFERRYLALLREVGFTVLPKSPRNGSAKQR